MACVPTWSPRRPSPVVIGTRKRRPDAPAPVALADDEAGHGPDAVVELVLAAALPRNTAVAEHARIAGPGLDCAPADRFAGQVRDETRRGVRARVTAARLLAQPQCEP
jgi:hypothetical protein